jgi:hypothetical protein
MMGMGRMGKYKRFENGKEDEEDIKTGKREMIGRDVVRKNGWAKIWKMGRNTNRKMDR